MQDAQSTKAGHVFVNDWFTGDVETPFGGYKFSGYGKENGCEVLWNYVQTVNVAINIGGGAGRT